MITVQKLCRPRKISTDISIDYRPTLDRYIQRLSSDYRPSVDRPSTECRPITDRYIDYRPTIDRYIDRLSTECRPSIERVSTECRPTIDRVSTAISTDISVGITHSRQDPQKFPLVSVIVVVGLANLSCCYDHCVNVANKPDIKNVRQRTPPSELSFFTITTITSQNITIIEVRLNESIVYTTESRRWNKISNSFNCSYPGRPVSPFYTPK